MLIGSNAKPFGTFQYRTAEFQKVPYLINYFQLFEMHILPKQLPA